MCVAGVDGTEVTGRMVAVQVVLGPDGIEGMLRPSTFPEVGALPAVAAPSDLVRDRPSRSSPGRRTCRCRNKLMPEGRLCVSPPSERFT